MKKTAIMAGLAVAAITVSGLAGCGSTGIDKAEGAKYYALVQKDGKYGYINANGKETIKAEYEDAGNFTADGLAYVKKDGK